MKMHAATAAVAALAAVGLPAAIVTRAGRTIAFNRLIDGPPFVHTCRGLALASAVSNAAFREALVSAGDEVRPVAVPAAETHEPLVVHIRRADWSDPMREQMLVVVTWVHPDGCSPSSELLRESLRADACRSAHRRSARRHPVAQAGRRRNRDRSDNGADLSRPRLYEDRNAPPIRAGGAAEESTAAGLSIIDGVERLVQVILGLFRLRHLGRDVFNRLAFVAFRLLLDHELRPREAGEQAVLARPIRRRFRFRPPGPCRTRECASRCGSSPAGAR